MTDILGLVLPFFGMILLGYLIARITRQPLDALGWMNTFVIYVALPALFFQLLSRTPVERLAEWGFILGSVFSTFVIFAAMFIWSTIRNGGEIAESTIKGLAAAYGNIGYLGPGLALIAFGEEAAVPVALIFCFENIMHFALAPMLMALAGGQKAPPLAFAFDVTKKILLHPFIIATALGVVVAWSGLQQPVPLERLMQYLSQAAAPCALFAMGVTLALRPLRRVPAELGVIAVLKLVIHPLICYVVLSWIGGIPETWLFTAVLLAALPSATGVYVIAQQYGVWVERASASVLITTMLSVVTVTALLAAIRTGIVPTDLFP